MSGIYFHIPFCKSRCFYCDFHTSVNVKLINPLFDTLKKELCLRKSYLKNDSLVKTIYFGGGTPSLLSPSQIKELILLSKQEFDCIDELEITMEANPDDLNLDYLKEIKLAGVNRLSIGVQSIDDHILADMNRRHGAIDVFNAINNAVHIGINNISIDLIYGVPKLSSTMWKTTIEKILSLPVTHISAYHLTYHEGTEFYRRLKKGSLLPVIEEESLEHYDILVSMLVEHGFEHYELSNFCKNGLISNHNSSYWRGDSYLGIGPSAHSYDGVSRQWNISNNKKYIDLIPKGEEFFEKELLSDDDRYNDYIITAFRTKWGVEETIILNLGDKYLDFFKTRVKSFVDSGEVVYDNSCWTISEKGMIRSDLIIENVFYCE
ncbi:radical SAM family heme chaperone HemW [Halosquirtibacter laminarini]|uniref:Radical SAM family heme chaperone HemW n=1 Tax=Halosquirtibacter laminarini TaxID=3374600 RepID=A0AC61NKB1_9BACT|nr:radical SAM family heme chaperone HemW [Prolixibacteraceae bacterium]